MQRGTSLLARRGAMVTLRRIVVLLAVVLLSLPRDAAVLGAARRVCR